MWVALKQLSTGVWTVRMQFVQGYHGYGEDVEDAVSRLQTCEIILACGHVRLYSLADMWDYTRLHKKLEGTKTSTQSLTPSDDKQDLHHLDPNWLLRTWECRKYSIGLPHISCRPLPGALFIVCVFVNLLQFTEEGGNNTEIMGSIHKLIQMCICSIH